MAPAVTCKEPVGTEQGAERRKHGRAVCKPHAGPSPADVSLGGKRQHAPFPPPPCSADPGKGSHRKHPTVYLPPWRVRGVRGPGGGHGHTSHHLEYITAAVTNYTLISSNFDLLGNSFKIGRASCRERVCLYV